MGDDIRSQQKGELTIILLEAKKRCLGRHIYLLDICFFVFFGIFAGWTFYSHVLQNIPEQHNKAPYPLFALQRL